jgi:hypothetical protein
MVTPDEVMVIQLLAVVVEILAVSLYIPGAARVVPQAESEKKKRSEEESFKCFLWIYFFDHD